MPTVTAQIEHEISMFCPFCGTECKVQTEGAPVDEGTGQTRCSQCEQSFDYEIDLSA